MRSRNSKPKPVPPVSAGKPIPPLADPAETVERVLSRRQLKIEEGDVVIFRTSGGLVAPTRSIYRLRVQSRETLPDQFATFERAAVRGDELVTRSRTRLFYLESEHEPPYLLKDARR